MEILGQMAGKYNPVFIQELFDGLASRSSQDEAWEFLVGVSEMWGYPPEEVAGDSLPAGSLRRPGT